MLYKHNSPSDIQTICGKLCPYYPEIRTTEGKVRGIDNIQKIITQC